MTDVYTQYRFGSAAGSHMHAHFMPHFLAMAGNLKPGTRILDVRDVHANPLWDGGHIKLWSRGTLSQLLVEAGFTNVQYRGAGRVAGLWMTMVAKAEKPR
jgi:hypothetical protein